jgi:serine/threonine protein phosphatase PrpC
MTMALGMTNTQFIPIEWSGFSVTDVGTVRSVNEDSLLMLPQSGLWAIADGMGGHQVGDIASRKIVDALSKIPPIELLSEVVDAVDDALINVNYDIIDYASQQPGNFSMGSTIVSLIIRGRVGVALWVGDSRLYRYRNGQLSQMTRDHSHVEELLQMGHISAEEMESHPQRNVITRAVGGEEELYADVNIFSAQIGDTFLLCSDGLYNAVPIDEITSVLNYRNAGDCAQMLMQIALERGANDNVSIIVLKGEAGR